MDNKKTRKTSGIVKIIGNIVTALAIVFIVIRLNKYGISWANILTTRTIAILAICIAIHTFLVVFNAVPWSMILDIFEPGANVWKEHRKLAGMIYAKANVMKYIPGNVFQYVGRNELAFRLGINHINVVAATITEVVLASLAVLLVSLICVGSFTIKYFIANSVKIAFLATIILALVFIAILILFKRHREKLNSMIVQCTRIIKDRSSRRKGFAFFLYYAFTNLCIGLVFAVVMQSCGYTEINVSTLMIILGAYALSWLAGYITPGSPGGIGVREFILISVIVKSNITNESTVMVASVILRIISICADLAALVILFCIYKFNNSEKEC